MEYTKDELVNGIKVQIKSSDNKAIHALMTIYSSQSDEEKCDGHTKELNGVGFGGMDSEILSSFAEQYNRNGSLSPKQMALVKRLMPKYAGQLLKVSFAKGNFETVKVVNPKTGRMVTKYRIVKK